MLTKCIVFDVFIGQVIDFVWAKAKEVKQVILRGIRNILSLKLKDPEDNVDMALYVNGELVLGSRDAITISTSACGEYLGDFSTELMLVYTDQLINRDAQILFTASEIVKPEMVGFGEREFKVVESAIYSYTVTIVEFLATIDPDPRTALENLNLSY